VKKYEERPCYRGIEKFARKDSLSKLLPTACIREEDNRIAEENISGGDAICREST